MKVLIVTTSSPSMRAEIWGWGGEDSDLYVAGKPIGMTPGPTKDMGWEALTNPGPLWSPKTIIEALWMGWKLLGPPQLENARPAYAQEEDEFWSWWLTKE